MNELNNSYTEYLLPPFSSREIDIISCLAHGKSTKGIANLLSLSSRTVENHIRNIMLKSNSNSRDTILHFVEKAGYISVLQQHYEKLNPSAYIEKLKVSEAPWQQALVRKKNFLLSIAVIGLSIMMGLGILFSLHFWKADQEKKVLQSDFVLPAKSIFLDRPQLLKKIDQAFTNKHEIQTVALVGMGGAGKTTLARHYAQQQNAKIVWEINAETEEALKKSFESLAYAFSKTEEDKKTLRDIEEIKKTNIRDEKILSFVKEKLKFHNNWFLLYDNVDNFREIQSYFPVNFDLWGHGKIIITTRNSNTLTNNPAAIIQVGELDHSHKLSLFMKIMTQEKGLLPKLHAEEISKFLNKIPSFPLDISLTAHYIRATNTTLENYSEILRKGEKEIFSIQENILKDIYGYSKTRNAIVKLSLQNIINIHPDFADLLLLISLLDSQNIPRDLLIKYKGEAVIDNFIYNLKKYSFIANEIPFATSQSIFSLHQSTQAINLEYLKKRLPLETNEKSLQKIIDTIEKHTDDLIENKNYLNAKNIITHLKKLESANNGLSDSMKGMINAKLGGIYFHLGYDIQAKYFLENSLRELGRHSEKNYTITANVLTQLGNVYRELAYYEKARGVLEKSLSIYKKNLPNNYKGITLALRYLGKVYRSLGNYEKAKEVLEESLAISNKHIPEKPIKSAVILAYLGNIYRELGDFQKARVLMEQSLSIFTKYYPKDHIEVARTLEYLGKFHRDLGYFKKATDLLEQSCAVYKKVFGENNIRTAPVLADLGEAYRKLGKIEEAKKLITQSLLIYTKHYPRDHIEAARVSTHLGNVYKDGGSYAKAKGIFKKNLAIYQKHYGEEHIETARVLRDLGASYLIEGDTGTAEDLLIKASKIFKKDQHPEIYSCLEFLAELYVKKSTQASITRDLQQAEIFKAKSMDYLKQALAVLKADFPADSPHIQRIQANLKDLEKRVDSRRG